MTKRFSSNGYYIYDHFYENKWLVNEVEVEEIIKLMNNLDKKARERSKALSKSHKENERLKQQNIGLLEMNAELRENNKITECINLNIEYDKKHKYSDDNYKYTDNYIKIGEHFFKILSTKQKKKKCDNCKHFQTDPFAGIWCNVMGNNKNYDCIKYEEKVI